MIDLSEERQGTGWKAKALALTALLVLVGAGTYHEWNDGRSGRDGMGCPPSGPISLNVLAFDTTDRLFLANPARVEIGTKSLIEGLPGGAKLVVVAIDSDVTAELAPAFLRCAPPGEGEGNPIVTPENPRQRARRAFEADAGTAIRGIAGAPVASNSPLAEQISKIVTDSRVLHRAPHGSRTVTIFTDLLQASKAGNVYRGTLRLPAKPPRVLDGWHVRFVQTTNPRDHALQTQAIRAEWRRWALAAGAARVTFEGSGFVDEVADAG